MLQRFCFVVAVTAVLYVPASLANSNENSFFYHAEKGLMEAIHARGRQQILEADISPLCRQNALTALAQSAAANAEPTCTTTQLAEGIGKIFGEIWDSIGNLMTDINTVINGIPVCMSQYNYLNVFGRVSCLITYIQPIWSAVKDIWHYNKFWMNPYNAVKEVVDCIHHRHTTVASNVQTVVQNARACK